MRSFREIAEKAGDTAVFTFGRFNPPTIGHEKLVNAVAKQQSKNAGSKMYVYASKSNDPQKNPLLYAKKIAYMRKMFKKYSRNIITGKPRTAIEVAVELYDKGHKAIVMVVGSDRVDEFDKILNEYNGVEGKRHGYYGFDNIEVVSAGERDPDAEGVEGMSASKMRDAAEKGDFDSFKTGIPDSMSDADKKKMYFDVRKGQGIREEREMGNDYDSLRDAYLTGKIWNVGEIVEAKGLTGEVVRKGTNYLSFMTEDSKVHKAWLHEIELDEGATFPTGAAKKQHLDVLKKKITTTQDKKKKSSYKFVDRTPKGYGPKEDRDYRKEYDNYQGKPEQIARRSSRNKARRVMGDKVEKGMDVGHRDNNPMNNDLRNLKNEVPSVNRREPRLREDNLDESWWKDLMTKISQIRHPKGWDKVVKQYVDGMKDPEHRKHPGMWANDVANEYNVRGIDGRHLIQYINKLVAKGTLPKELKAEFEPMKETMSFKDFVDQINNK